MSWKRIPVEGLFFKEMSISGNGKDCSFELLTKDPDKSVSFEMRDPLLSVDIQGKLVTTSFNYGDSDLGLKYIPSEEIEIVSAEVDFPGDDTE